MNCPNFPNPTTAMRSEHADRAFSFSTDSAAKDARSASSRALMSVSAATRVASSAPSSAAGAAGGDDDARRERRRAAATGAGGTKALETESSPRRSAHNAREGMVAKVGE